MKSQVVADFVVVTTVFIAVVKCSAEERPATNDSSPEPDDYEPRFQDQNALFDALTDSSLYDRRSRPRVGNLPVYVNTSIYVSVLGGLDAHSTEFTSQLTMRYQWKDQRLAYTAMTSHIMIIEAEDWAVQHIWIPTIYITNEKQSRKISMPAENVLICITPEGLVSYEYRMNLQMYCSMDARKFPFDQQTCRLHLESWSLRSSDLILNWMHDETGSAVRINPEHSMMEYRLEKIETSSQLISRSHGHFSRLDLSFILRREAGHYIIDYYIPAILLVFLSWVSFWLDPAATPGRVTLGSSTLLTLITLSRHVTSTLPKVSYIKALDLYSILCTIFIFCSLMEFAFVNNIWRRRHNIPIKKLDTRHVLKSTLTPNTSRRNSFSRLGELPNSFSRFSLNTAPQNELTVRSCNDLFEVKRRLSTCQFSASLGDVNVDAIDSSSTNWSHKHSTMSIGDSTGSMEPDAGCSISITVPSITKKAREDPSENQSRPGGLAKVEKACMTPQEIAKWIDRRSRVAFPTMFAVANLFYWSFISI